MSARSAALRALTACRRQGAWSDSALSSAIRTERLERRDAALAAKLCYGVQQNKLLLDFYLSGLVKMSLSALHPAVLDILRLAAYQILLLDKIPDSAAVNEAVSMTKKVCSVPASRLVNGVLRRLCAEKDRLPPPPDLATKYSHPAPLVDLLRESVGEELLERLLASHNEAPQTCIQVNTLKTDTDAVLARLPGAVRHPWLSDCLLLSGGGDPSETDVFREGLCYVQDVAARLSVLAAAPMPGFSVLDSCAAPGGKSFAAAVCMQNSGAILACDLHENKLCKITEGARRLGISILTAEAHDAREDIPSWRGKFDLVITDVPCSGLGVIRKKPDIREKDTASLSRLPAVQREILDTVSRYVRPGGTLLYSTCTILKRENEDVVSSFLAANSAFSGEEFTLPGGLKSQNGFLTLLPCVHGTDGFFIAKLRKNR